MTYAEGIELIQKNAPQHPLLRVFLSGETVVNRLLLEKELAKFSSDPRRSAPAPQPADPETDDFSPDPVDDQVLRRLRMQQSNLFAERAKLSNSFFNCANQAQRRKVSENIQILQAQIEMVRADIRTYRSQGRLPEPDEKYPVPENPFKLLALRQSLRSSISRKSGEILHLGGEILDKKSGAAERLAKAEAKMTDLKNHLDHVQKTIKARNIQPGRLSEG